MYVSCKKRIATLGSMQDTGCLGLVHRDDSERWYGEGVQAYRSIYPWDALKPRHHIQKQRRHFADKGSYNKSYVFSSSCV